MLAAATEAGIPIERHPEAKDATDLALALDAALARHPERIVVVTGAGDRLDHTLSLAHLLASPRTAGVAVEAWIGSAHLSVIRDATVLRGTPGDLVSLVPLNGPALGVITDGLLYPLRDEDLPVGSTPRRQQRAGRTRGVGADPHRRAGRRPTRHGRDALAAEDRGKRRPSLTPAGPDGVGTRSRL